jgi:hypothetical protein
MEAPALLHWVGASLADEGLTGVWLSHETLVTACPPLKLLLACLNPTITGPSNSTTKRVRIYNTMGVYNGSRVGTVAA